MKVVLLENIPNLGKKWQVKEVALGYAKNYLIPRGLAKIATPKAIMETSHLEELEAKKAEEALKLVQALVERIDGQELVIPVKVGEGGEVYGSVSAEMIAGALQKMGFKELTKSQVVLDEPIRDLGEHPVLLNFDHGLEAEIKVIVVEEKEKE